MFSFSKIDLRCPIQIVFEEKTVFEHEEQIENIVFQALAHPMRRNILKIVGSRSEGVTYSELLTELSLSTGKLNYHVEQLGGLIGKNDERRYVLTSFGKKALNQLILIKHEVTPEDEKYVRIAEVSQKSSLQPALKAFLLISIAFSSVVLSVWIYLTYVLITEGAPLITYVLMPILITIGIVLLSSLILAWKKTPEWIRRVERRLIGPP
jgi:DNA-binding transcriptional ArsR family regulator